MRPPISSGLTMKVGARLPPTVFFDRGHDLALLGRVEWHRRGECCLSTAIQFVGVPFRGRDDLGKDSEASVAGQHMQCVERGRKHMPGTDPIDNRRLLLGRHLRRVKDSRCLRHLGEHVSNDRSQFVEHPRGGTAFYRPPQRSPGRRPSTTAPRRYQRGCRWNGQSSANRGGGLQWSSIGPQFMLGFVPRLATESRTRRA